MRLFFDCVHRHALGQQGCSVGTQVPLASRSLPKFGFLRVLSLYVQNESKVVSQPASCAAFSEVDTSRVAFLCQYHHVDAFPALHLYCNFQCFTKFESTLLLCFVVCYVP